MMPSELLGRGPAGAVHLSDLAGLLHTDRRSVRLLIQRERLAGCPVLSDNEHGYYLAEDSGQVRAFCDSMRRRARSIQAIADAVLAGPEWKEAEE